MCQIVGQSLRRVRGLSAQLWAQYARKNVGGSASRTEGDVGDRPLAPHPSGRSGRRLLGLFPPEWRPRLKIQHTTSLILSFSSLRMPRFNLDDFLRGCRRSSDPTGGVWASARASVMQMLADPINANTEVPLIDVMALPADLPTFDLPERSSPLDGEEGEQWALLEAFLCL